MNLLFFEMARTIKNLPGLPENVKIGIIAQAIHDSDCGKTTLAKERLNFWKIRFHKSLIKLGREIVGKGPNVGYIEFHSLNHAAAAYVAILCWPRFANWEKFTTSPQLFLLFLCETIGHKTGEYHAELCARIPEARSVLGAV